MLYLAQWKDCTGINLPRAVQPATCHLKWSCRITVIKLKGGASSSFCFQGSPLPWMYHDTFGDNGVYKSVYGEKSENVCTVGKHHQLPHLKIARKQQIISNLTAKRQHIHLC